MRGSDLTPTGSLTLLAGTDAPYRSDLLVVVVVEVLDLVVVVVDGRGGLLGLLAPGLLGGGGLGSAFGGLLLLERTERLVAGRLDGAALDLLQDHLDLGVV